MKNYRWVSKTVADGWLTRYRKEMSAEEFNKWKIDFDKDTIVYIDVDGVQFLTKDYIRLKLESEELYANHAS